MRIVNNRSLKISSDSIANIIDWLMEGDPSIRWQVMRDLHGEDAESVKLEQARVAETGWGARLLSYQEPSGLWAGGLYSPKWISTTYTMLTLRRIGLPSNNPQARKGCQLLLDRGFQQDGGINYGKSHQKSEACITGMILSILAYFRYPDQRVDDLVAHLLNRQMGDGGWNCRDYKGDTHSSFNTSLLVLEGLLEYQKSRAEVRSDVEGARLRGHEFLLRHHLFKSHRTGEIVNPRMLRFPFPSRWFYDFLKALDYFQDYYRWKNIHPINFKNQTIAKLDRKHDRDKRFQDAIELLKKRRKSDGCWLTMSGPSGKVYFDMERVGDPSRWNTLRALRVLKWWEGDL